MQVTAASPMLKALRNFRDVDTHRKADEPSAIMSIYSRWLVIAIAGKHMSVRITFTQGAQTRLRRQWFEPITSKGILECPQPDNH